MQEKGDFDVIIAGGGPGGLAALLWCADLGMKAVLLEKKDEFGGQLLRTYNAITNYPGVTAANGRELRDIFLQQLPDRGVMRITGAHIVEADLTNKTVELADGTKYSGRAIIIATGVRRRELGIHGEREFRERGVLESGAKERNKVIDTRVVIVGGGDAALENALILSEKAAKVFVVHRRENFTARPDFLERARHDKKIEFLINTKVTALTGNEKLETAELENVETGELVTLAADAVLIRIGVEPNTELFRGQIKLDEAGYVVIDSNCATCAEGIFAVGDAANQNSPTISAAVGQASIAVRTILR